MSNNAHIENLIDLYGNDVLRIANMYIKDTTIAEDIFQEVFLKVSKKLHLFQNRSSEKTWIIRITINTCKDYLKSAWKTKVVSTEALPEIFENNTIDTNLIDTENSNKILAEILSLPLIYKDVIILYYYKSFSTSEISKILNIPETTTRTRLKRAREILKNKLEVILED